MSYCLKTGDDKRFLGDIYKDDLGRYWRVEDVAEEFIYYDDKRGKKYRPRQTTSRNISRLTAWYYKLIS